MPQTTSFRLSTDQNHPFPPPQQPHTPTTSDTQPTPGALSPRTAAIPAQPPASPGRSAPHSPSSSPRPLARAGARFERCSVRRRSAWCGSPAQQLTAHPSQPRNDQRAERAGKRNSGHCARAVLIPPRRGVREFSNQRLQLSCPMITLFKLNESQNILFHINMNN